MDGNPLEPTSTAATVRVERDGRTTVLDGPYADTKEQLGGYYVVNVPDRDSALAWAARCPCARFKHAIGLCIDPAIRRHLVVRAERLGSVGPA